MSKLNVYTASHVYVYIHTLYQLDDDGKAITLTAFMPYKFIHRSYEAFKVIALPHFNVLFLSPAMRVIVSLSLNFKFIF